MLVFSTVFVAQGAAGEPVMDPVGKSGNHYVSGVEGIKCASIPPAGVYVRLYNYYTAEEMRDKDGKKFDPGFDLTVYAAALRAIWITDKKLMGANFGMDAVVPFVYTDIKMDALNMKDDAFELGDIYVEPCLLAWTTVRNGDWFSGLHANG